MHDDEDEEIVSFRAIFSIALPVILMVSFVTDFGRMEVSITDRQVSRYRLTVNDKLVEVNSKQFYKKTIKNKKKLSGEKSIDNQFQLKTVQVMTETESTITTNAPTTISTSNNHSEKQPVILFWNKPYDGFSMKIPDYCPVQCEMKTMSKIDQI